MIYWLMSNLLIKWNKFYTADSPPPLSWIILYNNCYQSRLLQDICLTTRSFWSFIMDKKSEFTKHGLPLFDGHNCAFWSIRMKVFLQTQGVDIWQVVLNEYKVPTTIPIDATGKRLYESNSKAMYAILRGLAESEFVKVMHCPSAKKIWDKLKNIYEGDT